MALVAAIVFGPIKAGLDPRQFIRHSIPLDVWKRFSSREILRQLAPFGLSIRRQDFLEIRRQVLGLEKHEEAIARIKPERRIPKGLYVDDHGWELNSDFLYRFRVTGTNPITGEDTQVFLSLGTDKEISIEQAEADLLELLQADVNSGDIVATSVELRHALARPGAFAR